MASNKKTGSDDALRAKKANEGRTDTQGTRDGQLASRGNAIDQSEGAHRDGQTTARHGQGAGFGRNTR
jgi:hypothetical protein